QLTAATNLTRGPYEISVKNTNSESSKLKIYVDDLPQVYARREEADVVVTSNTSPPHVGGYTLHPPFSAWGTFTRAGKVDEIAIQCQRGESLVFDVAAKTIGSKANVLITLLDSQRRMVASNSGFDGADPLLDFKVPESGVYMVQISEKTDASS